MEPLASDTPPAGDLGRFATTLRGFTASHDVDEALQLLVDLGPELIAGCDHADVMLIGPDGVTTPVSTGPLATGLDRAQAVTDEGPCLEVARHPETVVEVEDLRIDARWPRFARIADGFAIRSAVSFELEVSHDPKRIGALNLYGHDAAAFDGTAVELGEVFAAQCATLLDVAIKAEGLRTALRSRELIGQAKGILMERHRLDAAAAFDLLRRVSQDRNLKLTDVAAYVVEQRQLPGV